MKYEILYTTEYGSKLYGTSTPSSDTDLKHIVLPDLNHLLLGKKIQNVVKKTNTEKNTRNDADDVDEEMISLQEFCRAFTQGQTYALELAYSIDGTHANQKIYDNYFETMVQELKEKFLTSNIKALIGYVVNQANIYSLKGERYNAVVDMINLLNSINYDTSAKLSELVEKEEFLFKKFAEKYPKYFKFTTYNITDDKLAPCFLFLDKHLPYSISFETCKQTVNNLFNKYGDRAKQASETNVDWKAMMHAVRICDEGISLLSEKSLRFPFPEFYCEHLLEIKAGKHSLEDVRELLSSKLDKLKELELTTELKPFSENKNREFEEWLSSWMRKFYL